MTGMTLELPERISLDSWVLKRLAYGDYPEATAMLRRRIDEGRSRIVVTIDHIADYGDCEAGNVAMKEAYFVDTLQAAVDAPGGRDIPARSSFRVPSSDRL